MPKILTLVTVDSTNTYCKNHSEFWDKQFFTVRAIIQTAGRGRFSRTWHSEPGLDLTFSVIYIPGDHAAAIPVITVIAGLAVYRAFLPLCGQGLHLKWPNDIYFESGKLGGILCELVSDGEKRVVIIGIGINVNGTGFPLNPAASPISLRIATGKGYDLEALLGDVLYHLESLLGDFSYSINEAIVQEWNAATRGIGQRVYCRDLGNEEYAIQGLSSRGAIILKEVKGGPSIEYSGDALVYVNER